MKGISLGQALTDMDAAIDPLTGRLADVVSTLAQIQQLKDLVEKQQIAVDTGLLEASSLSVTKNALDALQRDIENTATSTGLLPDQVVVLASATDQLGAATGIAQIRDEAAEALALIQGCYPAGPALPPQWATTASYLNEIVSRSAETTSELNDATSAAKMRAASAPAGSWIDAAIGGVNALIGRIGDAIKANAALAATRNFNRDSQAGSDVYSGRGGDPRDSMPGGNRSGGAFVYSGPALDRNNNPLRTGGTGGGGASAAKAEKDAVAELIIKLQEKQEVLRTTDPVKAEMLKYRKQLVEATAAERKQIEGLIEARMRKEAQLKSNKDLTDLLNNSSADFPDGVIAKGGKDSDVMRSLIGSLLSSGIQAFTKATGPLAVILGITGRLFDGLAGKADGGLITGAGGPRADRVLIMASAG